MVIPLHPSLEVAQAVLHRLEANIPEAIRKQCLVSCFSNYRQQGLMIECDLRVDLSEPFEKHLAVVVTKHENRDQIVIYWGKFQDFNYNNHHPNHPDVWGRARAFLEGDVGSASDFVIQFFQAEHPCPMCGTEMTSHTMTGYSNLHKCEMDASWYQCPNCKHCEDN